MEVGPPKIAVSEAMPTMTTRSHPGAKALSRQISVCPSRERFLSERALLSIRAEHGSPRKEK